MSGPIEKLQPGVKRGLANPVEVGGLGWDVGWLGKEIQSSVFTSRFGKYKVGDSSSL